MIPLFGKAVPFKGTLKSLIADGFYHVADAITDSPTADSYFLWVITGGSDVMQIAFVPATLRTYVRSKQSAWSAWAAFSTMTDVVQASGGTSAGALAWFNGSNRLPDYVPEMKERDGLGEAASLNSTPYSIKIGQAGAAVFDGDKLIASMGPLDEVVVHKDYTGQRIAPAMIATWYSRLGDHSALVNKAARTLGQQIAFSKAWTYLG